MKYVIAVAMLVASSALAQQPAQRPSDEEINARIQAISMQRDEQANRVAMLAGQMAVMQAERDKARKDAEACKPEAKKDDKK